MRALLHRTKIPLSMVLAMAGAVLVASEANSYYLYVINLCMINAIAAVGLVILSGVAGQISLGTAALLAIGSYSTAIMMVHLGLGFLPAAVLSAFVTTVIGTILAGPALRLTGLHVAIVTLAFGIIVVQLIGKGGKLTGGMSGMTLPPVTILGWAIDNEWRRFIAILIPFVLVTAGSIRFLRLKPGRALRALREREVAAQTLGINSSAYKILAFAYASFLGGVSGALYAGLKGYISVDDFTLWNSIYFFVMIALGGMTSIIGGVAGAFLVTAAPEFLRGFQEASQAVFGVLLFVIVVFLPGGIVAPFAGLRRRLSTRQTRATAPNTDEGQSGDPPR